MNTNYKTTSNYGMIRYIYGSPYMSCIDKVGNILYSVESEDMFCNTLITMFINRSIYKGFLNEGSKPSILLCRKISNNTIKLLRNKLQKFYTKQDSTLCFAVTSQDPLVVHDVYKNGIDTIQFIFDSQSFCMDNGWL